MVTGLVEHFHLFRYDQGKQISHSMTETQGVITLLALIIGLPILMWFLAKISTDGKIEWTKKKDFDEDEY